ncbi:MAG: hypothetical protein WBD20_15980 [Pirellulaceae bacterium]
MKANFRVNDGLLILALLILTTIVGCDTDAPQVVFVEKSSPKRLLYTRCEAAGATTKLHATVSFPGIDDISETVFLRRSWIEAGRYPSRPSGPCSAYGASETDEITGYNYSHCIEDAVGDAIAFHLQLSICFRDKPTQSIDELIWLTVDRRSVFFPPEGGAIAFAFSPVMPISTNSEQAADH